MNRKQTPEILLENLDMASGVPRQHLQHLLDVIINEVELNKLEAGTIISVGDYGHVRLDVVHDEQSREMLFVRDVEEGSKNANDFVARYMALKGFEHMENEEWPEALECFDFTLDLSPNDAVLLQSRASVKDELIQTAKTNSEAVHLVLGVFEDLLRSIELSPDGADAYNDLHSKLKGFRPLDGDSEEHRQWLSKVVDQALSRSTQNPEAIKAREALREFESNAG